jgi:hypothetical protein
MEQNDLVGRQTERVEIMKNQLETWQRSVFRSLKFSDYQ